MAKKADKAKQGPIRKTQKGSEPASPEPAESETIPGMPRLALLWFGLLFVGLVFLLVVMAWPFKTPIIFALIVGGAFYPVMDYLATRRRWNRTLAASVVCLLILLVVLLPTIFIAARLVSEVNYVIETVKTEFTVQQSDGIDAQGNPITREEFTVDSLRTYMFGDTPVADFGREVFEVLGEEYTPENVRDQIVSRAQSISEPAMDALNSILKNTLNFLFQFFMMLLVIFAVLQQGPRLKEFLLALSPLPREDEQLLIDRFNQMNFVTMVCNGLGGVIQGCLAGIGFFAAGFRSSLLWTVVMIVLAFVPLVGISFVYVPACIYLIIKGEYLACGLLFAWCTLVALWTENWFKPRFMGNRVSINSMLVFLSIIGGMSVFGVAGIFYGPLIVIIFLTFVELYHEKYARRINS